MAIQRLPVAYRSRSRPSSTLGAKASTMCSSYLDGDQPETERFRLVIPVRPGGLSQCRVCGCCTVFKDRREGCTPAGWAFAPAGGRSLKTQQHARLPVRVMRPAPCQVRSTFQAERSVAFPIPAQGRSRKSAVPNRSNKGLPRKEVIQPQLPLRLPCYDFTPVTSPTFDGSLPCGLGHRLRVLLTPVV